MVFLGHGMYISQHREGIQDSQVWLCLDTSQGGGEEQLYQEEEGVQVWVVTEGAFVYTRALS